MRARAIGLTHLTTTSKHRRVLALLMVPLGALGCTARQELKAKATIARMRELDGALLTAQVAAVDDATVARALRLQGWEDHTADAWGHRFLIEIIDPAGQPLRYRIRSVGRDGRPGPCCQARVSSYDDDVVMEDGVLLQNWSTDAE